MNLIKKFYEALPFNKAEDTIIHQRIQQPGTPWNSLTDAMSNTSSVLELGCGNGWLSNRIANNYPNIQVTGIDLVPENIEIANRFSIQNSKFFEENILESTRTADTVISVGVLHHIPDCDLVELMCDAVNKSNKYTYIGLYHNESRQAMFDFFESYSPNQRHKLFKKMTPWFTSETQRMSWWRDQFEHPYETTATLVDYQQVAQLTNTQLVWTSVDTDSVYDTTFKRLERYEFTSGFIYGLYQHDTVD